jgi:hypothetical protein
MNCQLMTHHFFLASLSKTPRLDSTNSTINLLTEALPPFACARWNATDRRRFQVVLGRWIAVVIVSIPSVSFSLPFDRAGVLAAIRTPLIRNNHSRQAARLSIDDRSHQQLIKPFHRPSVCDS